MASLLYVLILTLLAVQHADSLQVTPNSPCASVCIDSDDLDFSDPNSSTTKNADITCLDSEYSTSPTGQKFQSCMSCLQDSTFSQGSENDQIWFLYNLRYTFDYCIFGFPNATGVASTPCSTSFACGELQGAFTDDKLKTHDYSFCTADGGAMNDDTESKCLSCVAATEDQNFLANYLVALDIGCKQRPPTGMLIGLNDTVFSNTRISSVDPTAGTVDNAKAPALSTTQIAGIAIGAVVVILAVAGFLFVRHRKRRNRRLIIGGTRSPIPGQKQNRHRPASSLSFRCQTHLTPRSPFFPNPSDNTIEEEKPYANPTSALRSHPISPRTPSQAGWQVQPSTSRFSSFSRADSKVLPLHHIATAIPTIPSNVHYSTSPKAAFFSPTDEPASTTSTKSTTQLLPLRQYNPAEYGVTSPQIGSSPDGTFSSPISGSTSSPLMSRAWEQRTPTWDLPPRRSSRSPGVGAWERVAAGVASKNRRTSNGGSPVETKHFNFSFPPPPQR
ncbi:hypothetical protein GGR54DRAFT_437065 [Hypoxylon sp. NC1633]|nr:hypothetical protein GGR54DRAFT_437065 [Hypoxylon sp. NC1633]